MLIDIFSDLDFSLKIALQRCVGPFFFLQNVEEQQFACRSYTRKSAYYFCSASSVSNLCISVQSQSGQSVLAFLHVRFSRYIFRLIGNPLTFPSCPVVSPVIKRDGLVKNCFQHHQTTHSSIWLIWEFVITSPNLSFRAVGESDNNKLQRS